MKYDLLTIGDTSIDMFMKVDDATVHCDVNHENCEISFKYGEKIPVEEFRISVGGNSINVASGTSKLGLKTKVYTELGDDNNADLAINALKENGVSTEFCTKNKDSITNTHPIVVFKGERTIFSHHEPKTYKLGNFGKPAIVYYTSLGEGFEDFQKELLELLKESTETIFAMNPGSTMMKIGLEEIKKVFERLDILFVNKEEARKIIGKDLETDKLHKELTNMGIKLSVITDGTNGSSCFDGQNIYKEEIHDFGKKVDATGAGDSFAAGFLSAIHHKKSAQEALRWGSRNAGSVITKIGALEGLLTKEEI
jgi:ribokinase